MFMPTHIVAVAGLIRNAAGQVLLLRSSRHGWEFPGGQVEIGETLIEALMRETAEEAGIAIEVDRLVGVYSNVGTSLQDDGVTPIPTKVLLDFVGRAIGGELRTSEEHLEAGWFDRDQVLQLVTYPSLRDRVRVMLADQAEVKYQAYSTKPHQVHLERSI